MDTAKTVSISMPTFGELYNGLPHETQKEEVRTALLSAYRSELQALMAEALREECKEPQVRMSCWRQAGEQWICEFCVTDATLPQTSAINFHGHNTSQWRYGGAIVVQGGSVSCHH